jgi:hypothetical protein
VPRVVLSARKLAQLAEKQKAQHGESADKKADGSSVVTFTADFVQVAQGEDMNTPENTEQVANDQQGLYHALGRPMLDKAIHEGAGSTLIAHGHDGTGLSVSSHPLLV